MQKMRAERVVRDLFLAFKKALYEVIASALQLSFYIFRYFLTCHTLKTNCVKLVIQRYA